MKISINTKIIFFVLPLIITPLIFTAMIASLSARNSVTMVTQEYLQFKMEELRKHAATQWNLLVENDLAENDDFIEAAKHSVESFALSLIRKETELIFAVDENLEIVMQTDKVELTNNEFGKIESMISANAEGWQQIQIEEIARISQVSYFALFDWYLFVTEQEETYYSEVNKLFWETGLILLISLGISVLLLLIFIHHLIMPLKNVVVAMKTIISTNDLSKKVEVEYGDETGQLGHTFNIMTGQLEKAYKQIKGYALKAVIAQNTELQIRNIFQKYVPGEVINQFYESPENMLIGKKQDLAILFSDIRGFTNLSERLRPEEIVESLNRYFEIMVDIVLKNKGIVDKYIGDAIMAFFGAPVKHKNDPELAVNSALNMIDALKVFNEEQVKSGRPEFNIGIGISYGPVTIGNIGSNKKMDYTIIGDMVNLTSRLESLTKHYKVKIIISEYVQNYIKKDIPCRMLDIVTVRGKTKSVKIYQVTRDMNIKIKTAWKYHENGLVYYYKREFKKAAEYFTKVQEILPEDRCSKKFIELCNVLIKQPPGPEWNGVVAL